MPNLLTESIPSTEIGKLDMPSKGTERRRLACSIPVLSEQSRQFAGGQATLASIKGQLTGVRGTQEALERASRLPEDRPNDFSPLKMLERGAAR